MEKFKYEKIFTQLLIECEDKGREDAITRTIAF